MAKMTKAQAKRMVRDIEAKTKKLYTMNWGSKNVTSNVIVSTPDMAAIEKLTAKWMKRIG